MITVQVCVSTFACVKPHCSGDVRTVFPSCLWRHFEQKHDDFLTLYFFASTEPEREHSVVSEEELSQHKETYIFNLPVVLQECSFRRRQ